MKLIKINPEHYIIVDDSEIKEGDYKYHHVKGIVKAICNGAYTNEFKITHSTQPLEEYTYEESGEGVFGKDFFNIKPLDLSYIKSLVGEVDIEKRIYDTDFRGDTNSYKQGYIQAIEDNKDKRFSEEDIEKAIRWARKNKSVYKETFDYEVEEYISSLTQPKDTWEVYFDENNNLKLK